MAKNTTLSASDSIASLGAGIGMVPLMLYLESIAVAKALAMRNRYEVDASQELIAIGACNIVGSFFNAFPATGSFARSAVNSISGAASPASGNPSVCLHPAATILIPYFFSLTNQEQFGTDSRYCKSN